MHLQGFYVYLRALNVFRVRPSGLRIAQFGTKFGTKLRSGGVITSVDQGRCRGGARARRAAGEGGEVLGLSGRCRVTRCPIDPGSRPRADLEDGLARPQGCLKNPVRLMPWG